MTDRPCDVINSPMLEPVPHSPVQICAVIPIYRDDVATAQLLSALADMDIAQIYVIDGEGRLSPPHSLARYFAQSDKAACKAIWTCAPRGRGSQIAHGLDMAVTAKNYEHIWVLHADSQPHQHSPAEIRRILSQPETALGMFRLNFNRPQRAYRLFENFARLDSALTSFGDQGFFFRCSDLAALWPQLKSELAAAPILEDMILRGALKSIGRLRKSALKIGSSPRRFERYGLWTTQLRNSAIILRKTLGVSAQQLYIDYYSPAIIIAPPRRPRKERASAASTARFSI